MARSQAAPRWFQESDWGKKLKEMKDFFRPPSEVDPVVALTKNPWEDPTPRTRDSGFILLRRRANLHFESAKSLVAGARNFGSLIRPGPCFRSRSRWVYRAHARGP